MTRCTHLLFLLPCIKAMIETKSLIEMNGLGGKPGTEHRYLIIYGIYVDKVDQSVLLSSKKYQYYF